MTKNIDVSYKYWDINFFDLSDKFQIREKTRWINNIMQFISK